MDKRGRAKETPGLNNNYHRGYFFSPGPSLLFFGGGAFDCDCVMIIWPDTRSCGMLLFCGLVRGRAVVEVEAWYA